MQQAVPTVLPVAGAAVGTLFGGPVGTAIGAQLGGALGKAAGGKASSVGAILGQATSGVLPAGAAALGALAGRAAGSALGGQVAGTLGRAVGGRASRRTPVVAPPRGQASAANQLMSLINNPTLLQALLGGAMGPSGRRSVPVGPRAVPVSLGALMNALSYFATRAGEEYAENSPDADDPETESYLLDASGNFACDPAVSEARAERLLEVLRFAEQEEEAVPDPLSDYDSVTEWFVAADLVR